MLRYPRFTCIAIPALVCACMAEAPTSDDDKTAKAADRFDGGTSSLDGGSTVDSDSWSPPAECGAQLAGPALLDGVVEGEDDYQDLVDALVIEDLPAVVSIASKGGIQRAVINYMLQQPGAVEFAPTQLDVDNPLHMAVLAAVEGNDVNFRSLRKGLHHAYYCSRPLPASLAELVDRYGDYTTWTASDIECSKAKNTPRRLYAADDGSVYVAETLEFGSVRETEVLFASTRDDGQLDFAAYDDNGALMSSSTFSTASSEVNLAAPYTCMTCHVDIDNATLDRILPTGTGAGCRD